MKLLPAILLSLQVLLLINALPSKRDIGPNGMNFRRSLAPRHTEFASKRVGVPSNNGMIPAVSHPPAGASTASQEMNFPTTRLPHKRDGVPSDIDILNFALTLEHLENAFYHEGLAGLSQEAFDKAGYPDWVRGRFEQISAHENTHAEFISSAITAAGAKAVERCEYQFPEMDVEAFIKLSAVFESVAVSGYNGAAAFMQNKAYLTVVASILGVEARQAAWINSAVLKSNPWSTAFEIPLDMNQVFTLASPFIKSCPSSNPSLTVKAFPSLTIPACTPGQNVKLTFEASEQHSEIFAAFVTGIGTVFVSIDEKHEVQIPGNLLGLVYVIVTSDGSKITDDVTVAGPAVLELPFDSNGKV